MPSIHDVLPETHLGSLELTEEIIRLRAYYLYLQRGCENGHDQEDWLRAEAEVFGKKPSVSQAARERIAETTVAAAA